jgi:hypothetical protein
MAAANPLTFKTFVFNDSMYATQIKASAEASTDPSNPRQPVHLITLLDTSGSMNEEDKLTNVISSLKAMLEHMTSSDYLTLITYNTTSKLRLNQKLMTPEGKEETVYVLNQLHSGGMTNMSSAILLGTESLLNNPSIKECILLLTDGHANVGVAEPEELVTLLQGTMTTHPSLSYTTIGYGTDHNSELLTRLAAEGGGSYNVVKSLEDTAVVFGDILGGLLTCVAQNVKVEYPAGTAFMTGYAVHDNTVCVGDIQSEGEVFILTDKMPVVAKGYYLPGGVAFNEVIASVEPSDSDSKAAMQAYMRYKVADIMKKIVGKNMGALSLEQRTVLKTQIDELKAEVTALPESSMRSLLEKQLNDCRELIDNFRVSAANMTILSQQSACIATGRGILSGDHDPADSPFANHMQRNISTGMRSNVQRQVAAGYSIYTQPENSSL